MLKHILPVNTGDKYVIQSYYRAGLVSGLTRHAAVTGRWILLSHA